MVERCVSLVLHDVAPHTWPLYQPFVEAVDALGRVPITWLVVPNFHHHQPLAKHPDFRRQLERRLARGDELVLHGCFHSDDAGTPATARDWFMRRIYTWEGEFYALSREQAQWRIEAGIALFRQMGWPLGGFVAPAWLMSAGTREALRHSGLRYTSDTRHLYRLPEFQAIAAPGLVWSAGGGWRRGVSWLISETAVRLSRQAPLLRLGLHPVDMQHRFARLYWLRLLRQLLHEGRIPTTKSDWLERHASAARWPS